MRWYIFIRLVFVYLNMCLFVLERCQVLFYVSNLAVWTADSQTKLGAA